MLRVPYDDVEKGIRLGVPRLDVRENYLGVLPLIRDHFREIRPDFVNKVDRRYYSVGRGLMVPFDPPMVYGVGGKLYFPWFSFWRSNPLDGERLSLFVTLVKEVLQQDPDLDSAQFDILDFSAPLPKSRRELNVIDSGDIPIIGHSRKLEMLEIFAEGYFQALAELASAPEKGDENGQGDTDVPGQPRFL